MDLAKIRIEVIRVRDVLKRPRDQFRLRVADRLAERRIDSQPAAIETDERHADGGRLERIAKPLFARLGGRLGVLQACDVPVDPNQSDDLPSCIADRHLGSERPCLGPAWIDMMLEDVRYGLSGRKKLALFGVEAFGRSGWKKVEV